MMFCGTTFCGGIHTLDGTPTDVTDINKLTLQNTIYDTLFATKDVIYNWDGNQRYDWDYKTILCAEFKGDLHAGNTNYNSSNVDKIKIKRRKVGEYEFKTLFEIPINEDADFTFNRFDYLAASAQEYEYAIVASVAGSEGIPNTNKILSEFEGTFLVEKEMSYQALLNMELNHKRTRQGTSITTLGKRYPFHVSNGASNYTSGSLSATYIPSNNGMYDVDNGWKYRETFNDFITNGKPKILKNFEGKMWIVYIEEDSIDESQKDHYQNVVTSFNWFEVGDANNSYDLFVNGFIDEKPAHTSSIVVTAEDETALDRIEVLNNQIKSLKNMLDYIYEYIPNEILFNNDSREISIANRGNIIDKSIIPEDISWEGDE